MTPLSGLPSRVEIVEVGPRDGLQNESTVLPVAVKAEFVGRLVAAGLKTVEVTSMVRTDLIPQLADGEELLGLIGRTADVRYPVLVPNVRGLERAMAHGVRDIAVFASATETFAQRNLNCSIEESLARFAPAVAIANDAGLRVRGYLSMCYVDPWEGFVDPGQVAAVAVRLIEMGCDEISLGDTIGAATPGDVLQLLETLGTKGIQPAQLAVHFHDTYGQALSNTLIALQYGIAVVDSSAGGLGGCPFAKSATGNLATEDLLYLLNGLGIETGVNLPSLVATSRWMADLLGRPSPSAVVRAFEQAGAAS